MILFVSNSPFLGGAEHYLLDIIRGLKRDFKIVIAVPNGLMKNESDNLSVETLPLNIGSTLGRTRGLGLFDPLNLYRVFVLRSLLTKLLLIDSRLLIHTQDYKEMILFTLAMIGLPVRLVYVQHIIIPNWLRKNPLVLPIIRLVWNRQDQIVAVSDGVRNDLIKLGVIPSKVRTVHNGIDPSLFKPFSGAEKEALKKRYGLEGKRVIGINGRIAWGKGQDILISALPEIQQDFPKTKAAFVGTGSPIRQRKLDQLVSELNLQKDVTFFGSWPRTKIPEYYGLLDVFALPSLEEGLPLSILEAMACEVPCVGTKIAGIPEEIQDGQNGYLMSERTPHELARVCVEILKDDKLKERFGRRGREIVENHFTIERMVSDMRGLYQSLIK